MKIKPAIVGEICTNCYVVFDEASSEGLVIDPGAEFEKIERLLKKYSVKVKYVILTHGHYDHIAAAGEVKKFTGAPILVQAEDAAMLSDPAGNGSIFFTGSEVRLKSDRSLSDGEFLEFGACKLQVLHTPGHSYGGICLAGENVIFTGDTLFRAGIGRTDIPNTSYSQIMESIRKKLMIYPDDTIIYPGHGYISTIGEERKNLSKY